MLAYENKLKNFIEQNQISAVQLFFKQSCHTVSEAAQAVKAGVDDLVKSICLIDRDGRLVVAIVKGENKVDVKKVNEILGGSTLSVASSNDVLAKTGYPPGGTPSFGFKAIFLIDEKVMEKDYVYSGGGSEHSLIKISPHELQKANNGLVLRIRI